MIHDRAGVRPAPCAGFRSCAAQAVRPLAMMLAAISVTPLVTPPVAAQRLFGTVVGADGRTPAVGAIVMAFDSTGTAVGRELTATRGDFVIPLPAAGRHTLVTQRVGSLPDTTRDIEVGVARDVRVRVTLSRAAPRPPQVTQRTREVCDLRGDTTGLAGLWAQFQVALTTAAMAEESRAFVATWTQLERTLDANLRDTVSRTESVVTMGLETPVFPVLRPDSSSRAGFVLETDRGVLYYVPGTATLRAPSFLNRRCFAWEPAPDARPGWTGLHFRATGYRIGVSDIEGTIWFEAATLEPRALTYTYGGLPPSFAPARSGGGLRFRLLPTGHRVVDEWMLRIPSGRYRRMFAYDAAGTPNGYGNLGLDGVRITTARLTDLVINGTNVLRSP